VFHNYAVAEMMEAVKRAEASFHKQGEWQDLIERNMKLDFSWNKSARKYEEIYLRARNVAQVRRP
jgi:starch synthase